MFYIVLPLFITIVAAVRELSYITVHNDENGNKVYEMKISQPHVKVYEADQYICFSKYLEELGEAYIVSQYMEFDHEYVHHVSSGFCDDPVDFAKQRPWECSNNRDKFCPRNAVSGFSVDDFNEHPNGLFAFPKDVSFKVGSMEMYKYLTYEAHFKKPVLEETHPLVNITLTFIKAPTKYNYQNYLMAVDGYIPANKEKGYWADVGCPWTKPEVFAFGVELHTHHYGYLGEAYRIRNGTWTLLASRFTQGSSKNMIPVIGGYIDIRPGDVVAARCLYINKGKKPVKFGLSDGEEMCNIFISFGYDIKDEERFYRTGSCVTLLPQFSFCDHEQTNAICGKNNISIK